MSNFTIAVEHITPATYGRANLKALDAVTVWTVEHGYVTINEPQAVFFPSHGGVTVKGRRADETVKGTNRQDCLHSLILDGEVYPVSLIGPHEQAILDLLSALGL